MTKIIVPKLRKGNLVTLNSKGVEYFSNKKKREHVRFISLSLAYPSRDKFNIVGIVTASAYDMEGKASGGRTRLVVDVAWCHETPKTTKIAVKWLKKVYYH